MNAPVIDLEASLRFLQAAWPDAKPTVGLVLGSGLGFFADTALAHARALPYAEIPGFPQSTVEGHAGRLVLGEVGGKTVLCLQGRFHYYEGYPMDTLTMPIRLMARLGVQELLLTNAAGGHSGRPHAR